MRARRNGLVVAVCAAGLAVGAAAQRVPVGRYVELRRGSAAGHPYPIAGADMRRSGRSRVRAGESPRRVWERDLGHRRLTPPAVLGDGSLAVGSAAGLHGFGPDGGLRFFAPIGAIQSTPTVTPFDQFLVATADGALHLVDARGHAREIASNLPLLGSPLSLDNGAVIIGGRDARVHVLDLDGTRIASVPTRSREVLWTAAVGEGLYVAAGRDRDLTLFSLHSGREREIALGQRVSYSPAVGVDGAIWAWGEHGTLFAVEPTGRVRAKVELGAAGSPIALGADGSARLGLTEGAVVCIGADGVERWQRGVDGRPGPILLDATDAALLLTSRGTLYAIEADGEVRYRRPLGIRGAGRPVLARDGTIYVVSQTGRLQAWH